MTGFIQQLTTNFVVGGLALFALSLGFFAISYLNRRRQMLHQERMATLIKGLHYAGVAHEVFGKQKPDGRDHLLRGLRWLLGALGLSGTMYGYAALQDAFDWKTALRGALIGLIPFAMGLANLLFSWISSRRSRAPKLPALNSRLTRRA